MPRQYLINGPAVIYTGTAEEFGPESLGVSESGVTVNYRRFRFPIHTDVSGPFTPAAMQEMGMVATVSFKLVVADPDVLDRCRAINNSDSIGALPSTGLLLDPYSVPLWITSASAKPHRFANAVMWEGESELLSTKRTEDDIQFFCWAPVPATADTALDLTLWTYENPPGWPFTP